MPKNKEIIYEFGLALKANYIQEYLILNVFIILLFYQLMLIDKLHGIYIYVYVFLRNQWLLWK